MSKTREEINADPLTVEYKTELYALRNQMLDYLIEHRPDQNFQDMLNRAEFIIQEWSDRFKHYLVTDDDYYSLMCGKVLRPVYAMLSWYYEEDDDLEERLEKAEKERDEALEALSRIKRSINSYYGLPGEADV